MIPAINTVNLSKKFARSAGYRDLLPFRKKNWVTAVNELNLEVNEGEFFGLLGPNGAGKTTLVKMLCCLVLPTSGEARVMGHEVRKEEQKIKELVGLVNAEERSFYWRLSGRENLNFFASLYHIPKAEAKVRINRLLEMLKLDSQADISFRNYSTGMKQKLAIARGLLSEPRILFLDEPTRSLDPISAKSVRSFLKEQVVDRRKTIILATHNLAEAESLCDRLAIMNHGRVIADGTVRQLGSFLQTHEECLLKVKHFSESTLVKMENIPGVLSCQARNNGNGGMTLELKIHDRERVLPQLLETVMANGAEVIDCQIRELPLESIFDQIMEKRGID